MDLRAEHRKGKQWFIKIVDSVSSPSDDPKHSIFLCKPMASYSKQQQVLVSGFSLTTKALLVLYMEELKGQEVTMSQKQWSARAFLEQWVTTLASLPRAGLGSGARSASCSLRHSFFFFLPFPHFLTVLLLRLGVTCLVNCFYSHLFLRSTSVGK